MARKVRGEEILARAKESLKKAKTVNDLRKAQAVVFPLEHGMSLKETAEAIGVSKGWACQLRNCFIREGGISCSNKKLRGGRRRENMSVEEEKKFLLPFFEKAKSGGILVVNDIKEAMDKHLGRNVALSSTYNLLHRHGWRKLTPTKRHPQSDIEAQEEWKKKLSNTIAIIDEEWSGEAPIKLMFMDEARFGRISETRKCWCPKPLRPICYSMITREYTYAYAAVSIIDGKMDSLILPYTNGDCMQIFLDEISNRYPNNRVIMTLDGAGWHRNESLIIPDNIRFLSLPPYSPELNPVEHIWDDLREKAFHNIT